MRGTQFREYIPAVYFRATREVLIMDRNRYLADLFIGAGSTSYAYQ